MENKQSNLAKEVEKIPKLSEEAGKIPKSVRIGK